MRSRPTATSFLLEKIHRARAHEPGPGLENPHERAHTQTLHAPRALQRASLQSEKLGHGGESLLLNLPHWYKSPTDGHEAALTLN